MKRLAYALANVVISSVIVFSLGALLTPFFENYMMSSLEGFYVVLGIVWILLLYLGYKASQRMLK